MKTKVRILSSDPGSSNYGLAVTEFSLLPPLTREQRKPKQYPGALSRLDFKLLELKKVDHLYKDLKKGLNNETVAYIQEVAGLARKYEVDFFIAERYQSRRMGGVTIELVNQMLGTLRGIAVMREAPLRVIPASQWKVPLGNQGFDITSLYKQAKAKFKVSDHEIDALFIGLYGAFALMKRKPFLMDDVSLLEGQVLKEIERLRRE